VEEAPELRAAPDQVLPEPALGFMDTKRARVAGREPLKIPPELVRVQPVPVLVHGREERLHRLRVVVRRNANVVHSGAGGEWMLGRVESPRIRPEAEQLHDLFRQPFLALDRAASAQKGVVDFALTKLRDQRDELGLELVEDLPYLRGRRVRLEVVEQDVVRLRHTVEARDIAPP